MNFDQKCPNECARRLKKKQGCYATALLLKLTGTSGRDEGNDEAVTLNTLNHFHMTVI